MISRRLVLSAALYAAAFGLLTTGNVHAGDVAVVSAVLGAVCLLWGER